MNELQIRQKVYSVYNNGGKAVRAAVRAGLALFYRALHRRLLGKADLDGAIERFRPSVPAGARPALKKAMRRDCVRFLANPDEYFLYRFDDPGVSREKKNSYLTYDRRGPYTLLLNEPRRAETLSDKAKTYELFRDHFRRALLKVDRDTPDEAVLSFFARYGRAIVKPPEGSMGKGIRIFALADFADPADLLAEIRAYGYCVAEELIPADPFMAALHPQSLNTIRVPTFLRRDGAVEVFHPFLRVGRGGSVVDNAGSGGLFANIDASTGEVITDAVDEAGNAYVSHPDTGAVFKGMRIPKWDELTALADRLARVLPTVRFIGFDLALTPDGWVMVEGNRNPQPVQQMVDRVGLRDEFERLLRE